MKRQSELEQIHRLSVKTLDQVFVARAQEGLGCSLFEAQALTDLVRDVHFPWLTQPEMIERYSQFPALRSAGIVGLI